MVVDPPADPASCVGGKEGRSQTPPRHRPQARNTDPTPLPAARHCPLHVLDGVRVRNVNAGAWGGSWRPLPVHGGKKGIVMQLSLWGAERSKSGNWVALVLHTSRACPVWATPFLAYSRGQGGHTGLVCAVKYRLFPSLSQPISGLQSGTAGAHRVCMHWEIQTLSQSEPPHLWLTVWNREGTQDLRALWDTDPLPVWASPSLATIGDRV